MAELGAAVVAFDYSEEFIARARERTPPAASIEYHTVDAGNGEALLALGTNRFTKAVCTMALMDMPEIGPLFAVLPRLLTPGGVFVFSILHPCFPGWDDDAPSSWPVEAGYHQEGWWLAGNTGFRGKVGANHRTLSTYLNRLTAHGLPIDVVVEPPPDAKWAARRPGTAAVPVHLVARWGSSADIAGLAVVPAQREGAGGQVRSRGQRGRRRRDVDHSPVPPAGGARGVGVEAAHHERLRLCGETLPRQLG